MNNTLKTTIFWILALFITLSAAFYQRLTGPTHPQRLELKTNTNTYKLKLVRSHGGDDDCPVNYNIPDSTITCKISFRRFPTNDDWQIINLRRENSQLVGKLPHQDPAGKIEYKVSFFKNNKPINNPEEYHVVVRFKGGVPNSILIPHVLLMFIAMLLSNFVGILAFSNDKRMIFYTKLTFIVILIGGMIFGPLMQLYAFGELWTGFPKGMDLTDNKTLIAFVFWIIAVIKNRKQQKPFWIILASVIMLMVYLIPHSMFGSELNYESGNIISN
jgi:hypothetical protein